MAFAKNTTLERACLDWNPFGATGAHELLKAQLRNPCRELTLEQCDLWMDTKEDPKCKFNYKAVSGSYTLDLSEIIDRAVLYRLVILAIQQEGENIQDALLDGKPWSFQETEGFFDPLCLPKQGTMHLTCRETNLTLTLIGRHHAAYLSRDQA